MPHYSPELIASVVHEYVHTDKPTQQIAAEHAIDERDVTRIRHAEGIPTRRTRVRGLPPAMREVHEATTRLITAAPRAAAEDVGRNTRGEAGRVAPDDAGGAEPLASRRSEGGLPGLIARVQRLVEHELAAEEATRAELGMLARTPTESERCARTVASMTRTLHVLMRLRASAAPEQGPNNDDDMPADIDDFRNELARRIRAFVRSRTGAGISGSSSELDGTENA